MMTFRRLLICLTLTACSLSLSLPVQAQALPAAEEKKTDKAQMLQIWKALMAYKEAKGQLPDSLSDLVPEYLPDKAVLLSPSDNPAEREAANPFADPKLPCSYLYAFRAAKIPGMERTVRDMMEALMEEFGPAVPILQRISHGLAMNVAYSGDFFESQAMWQSAPETKELMKKLGIGPGLRNGISTSLTVVDEGAAPVSDAEVQLTGRYAQMQLPDRTLKTDATGTVRVPLAPKEIEGHRLTVKVSKPGYFALSENWSNRDFQEERSITLAPAAIIGGTVKLKDGAPLPAAEVLVKVLVGKPQEKNSEQVIAQVKADAEGRWKCDGVPTTFETLKLVVKHSAIRPTDFSSASESTPATREALLAGNAELLVVPAPVIRGEVADSDGKPIRNAEVFLRPLVLKSSAPNINGAEQMEPSNEAARLPEPPVKTDHKGSFSIPWPEEGQVLVTVFAEEHAPLQQAVTASAETIPLKLSLETGRVASGKLSDYEGKPVSGAEVYLFMLGQNGLPVRRKVATTDGGGRFSWDKAPNRPFTLLFLCDRYAGALKDLKAGGPVETTVKIGRSSE